MAHARALSATRRLMTIASALVATTLIATDSPAAAIQVPQGSGSLVGVFEGNAGLIRNRSIGQTFVIPSPTSENILTRLSFSLFSNEALGPDFEFSARLYEFDAATRRVVGGALFDSGVQLLAAPPPGEAYVDVSFTPNLALTAGTTYLAFVSTQGGPNDDDSRSGSLTPSNNPYADGLFAVQYSSSFDPQWETEAWQLDGVSDFGGFEAVFVATIPVPPALAMLGPAMLALSTLTRRHRRP